MQSGFTVQHAIDTFGLIPVAGISNLNNEIKDVYIGDLLSWVMGRATENCAWITIQGHINIIAVALLVNCSCIIITEGSEPDADALRKADSEEIPVLKTNLTSYELAAKFANLGN